MTSESQRSPGAPVKIEVTPAMFEAGDDMSLEAGPAGALKAAITAAVIAELDEYIDPPTVTGLTVPRSDRLWIARRVAGRVVRLDTVVKGGPQHRVKSERGISERAERLAKECAALPTWTVPPELEQSLKPQTPFS